MEALVCISHDIKCLQSLHLGHQARHSHMFTHGSNVASTPDVFCRIKNILANHRRVSPVGRALGDDPLPSTHCQFWIGLAVPGYGWMRTEDEEDFNSKEGFGQRRKSSNAKGNNQTVWASTSLQPFLRSTTTEKSAYLWWQMLHLCYRLAQFCLLASITIPTPEKNISVWICERRLMISERVSHFAGIDAAKHFPLVDRL